jgi:serine/threonine-protein kinase
MRGRVLAERYRVLGPIGQGGLGQVYEAEQIGLDRRVALKLIRPERKADPVVAARFVREARAAGRIASPHVVTLYDCGRDGDELYVAMERLEGETLADRLRRGPLPLSHAARVAAAIARGLRAAHEAGVLHRDLKPDNVFVSEDGLVKVLDFGIAKLLDDSGEPLTAEHRLVGTPLYMSPEAVAGKELGPTADLYGLGVILFEMLTGEAPFRTGEVERTLRAHLLAPVPRFVDVAPWLHVPPELDALVSSLLAKDPSARPRDAGLVASQLERIAMAYSAEATVVSHGVETPTAPGLAIEKHTQSSDEQTALWDGPRATEPAPSEPATRPKPETTARQRAIRTGSMPKLEPVHASPRMLPVALAVGALVFVAVLLARLAMG